MRIVIAGVLITTNVHGGRCHVKNRNGISRHYSRFASVGDSYMIGDAYDCADT